MRQNGLIDNIRHIMRRGENMEIRNRYDDEKNILEDFRSVSTSECDVPEDSRDIFLKIHNEGNWNHWVDTSDNSLPPPDFYSDDFKIMMEVMRIDDIGYSVEKRGKIKHVNLVNAEENKIKHEMEKSGVLDLFSNDTKLFINPKLPDLSTKDFRNYSRYKSNLKRIVDEHKKSIKLYRKNHPGFKLIFFIFDESEEYIEVIDEKVANEEPYIGRPIFGSRHYPFLDKALMDSFIDSDIDYLAWFMPYKLILDKEGKMFQPFPKVLFFDLNNIPDYLSQLREYDEKRTISYGN